MIADRAPHRAAQPGRQGAARAARRHRRRVLVVRARPGHVHPRPVLQPARRTCATAATAHGCGLLITDVFGGVFIRLKVAFLAGVVLSAPFWLYQLWAFITPGLKRNEKRYGDRLRRRLDAAVRRAARCWPTSRCRTGLQLLLGLAGNGVDRRAHRAGLHRLRALAADRLRGQLRGAADRGRAQPGRRPQLRRCWPRAGAGSSSSPSSSPRSSRRRRTRSPCC